MHARMKVHSLTLTPIFSKPHTRFHAHLAVGLASLPFATVTVAIGHHDGMISVRYGVKSFPLVTIVEINGK